MCALDMLLIKATWLLTYLKQTVYSRRVHANCTLPWICAL